MGRPRKRPVTETAPVPVPEPAPPAEPKPERPKLRPEAERLTPFGLQLRAARRAAGYTTAVAAAERAGFTKEFLVKLETTAQKTAFLTVHRLVVSLGLPLEHFFPGEHIEAAAARLKAARATARK